MTYFRSSSAPNINAINDESMLEHNQRVLDEYSDNYNSKKQNGKLIGCSIFKILMLHLTKFYAAFKKKHRSL